MINPFASTVATDETGGRGFRHRAEALAAVLPPLLVEAQQVAATVAQGVHGRRRVGTGETFWQFRRYHPGDPVQRIDWRRSAKADGFFVRELEWEAAQSVWLWCDASASMHYRSAPDWPEKWYRSALLALALAVLLVRGQERVALLGDVRPPSTGRLALDALARRLLDQGEPGTGANLPPRVETPRRATVVLIGDFLSPLEPLKAVLDGLAARSVRGHMLQVLDPCEEDLPFAGRVRFQGLEGENDLLLPRVDGLQDAYRERLVQHRGALTAMAQSLGWQFSHHSTRQPAARALLSLYSGLATGPQTMPAASTQTDASGAG